MASILTVFDISPEVDADGKPMMPAGEYTISGLFT